MKDILVAGGAGFVGSHLCEILLRQGHRVTCIDNFYTGRYENISHLYAFPYFKFIRHDVLQLLSIVGIDEIYNLACPASPLHYQKDSIYTLKTSVIGTLNLLELARKNHSRFLQASTSEVYGDPQVHPQTETYWGNVNPNGVRSCYDEGKRCAESLCMDYYRQHGLPVKIIRIFNTYGPNMSFDDGRVVSNFIIQALRRQDITLYGDGSQTRSFQYIDDLIDGMLRMMCTVDSFTGPVNLGNPEECTIKDLAVRVIKLTQSDARIVCRPLPMDDPCRRKPDIGLACRMLEWKPMVSLNEGLLNTIHYFKNILNTKEHEEVDIKGFAVIGS